MNRLILIAVLLGGCSTVQLNCPADHEVTAMIGGPDYAQIASQLVALIGPLIGSGALLGGRLGAAATPANDGTLTIKTLAIGQQKYSCGNAAPAGVHPPVPAVKAAPAPQEEEDGWHVEPAPLPPTSIIHSS